VKYSAIFKWYCTLA